LNHLLILNIEKVQTKILKVAAKNKSTNNNFTIPLKPRVVKTRDQLIHLPLQGDTKICPNLQFSQKTFY